MSRTRDTLTAEATLLPPMLVLQRSARRRPTLRNASQLEKLLGSRMAASGSRQCVEHFLDVFVLLEFVDHTEHFCGLLFR